MTPTTLVLLSLSALAAGFVDAVSGGGGVITMPALLLVGLTPTMALGTNKAQAILGSSTSLWAYARAGKVERKRATLSFPLAFVGSLAGAQAVRWVEPARLQWIIVVLLGFAVALMLAGSRLTQNATPKRGGVPHTIALIAIAAGFYDGFFGPGTGTLLIVAYVALLGDSAIEASANAKVANFASNLAAVLSFGWAGAIQLPAAVAMGIAQLAGSFLGARAAMKQGSALVRPMVVGISLVLIARVIWQVV